MPRANTTRYALLGVLRIAPFSGYDIKKLCDMSISHFWSENYGHIYPTLKKLEGEGLVTSESHQTAGRPPSSIYRITKKGTEELRQWLLKPAENHPMRFELMLKVFFGQDLPATDVIAKLKSERDAHAAKLQTYRGIEESLKNEEPQKSAPGQPFWLATLDFGKRFSKAMVEWCEDTIRAVESGAIRADQEI
ncbi:MAG: PadR family transcriptional regulator [Spirochaetia bacterium]